MSDGLWSMITLVALVGWIGSAIVFIFKAFPGRGRFEARPAKVWGGIFVIMYALWVTGLLNA